MWDRPHMAGAIQHINSSALGERNPVWAEAVQGYLCAPDKVVGGRRPAVLRAAVDAEEVPHEAGEEEGHVHRVPRSGGGLEANKRCNNNNE